MSRTNVRVSGADQIQSRFDTLRLHGAVSQAKIRKALRAGGMVALNAAKANAPVRTGTLRRSLAIEDGPGPETVSIGTDVEYAPYVEYGTSRMAARPYLRPAVDQNIAQIQKTIGDALWALVQAAA